MRVREMEAMRMQDRSSAAGEDSKLSVCRYKSFAMQTLKSEPMYSP